LSHEHNEQHAVSISNACVDEIKAARVCIDFHNWFWDTLSLSGKKERKRDIFHLLWPLALFCTVLADFQGFSGFGDAFRFLLLNVH
jgi:hypothetical protein